MFFYGQCWQVPLLLVWVIGILLAIGRWQRHPQVSAAVLISMACMLFASLGQQAVFELLRPSLGGRLADVVIYYQITAAVASLIRAAGWVAMLVAIFGWRDAAGASRTNPLQFNIRGLLVVTFVVAVLCGLFRGLAALLGESANILLMLLDDIPVLLCWLLGGWLAWVRRQRHPEVSRKVLTAIALQFTSLVVSIAVMAWLITGVYSPEFTIISSLVWFGAGTISWVLLLSAAFSWRALYAGTPGSPLRESPA